MRNSSTPLTPSQQAAFEQVEQAIEADSGTMAHETAVDCITRGGFERPEAQDLLEQLLLKGYLYETQAGLRITK